MRHCTSCPTPTIYAPVAMSATYEGYRLPLWAPFKAKETLQEKVCALLSVFVSTHLESPFRKEGQETPSLDQIDGKLVECVADVELLEFARHSVATWQFLWKKDALEHLQLAGAKEEVAALAEVDVGAFVARMAVRSLRDWFSENWSVYARALHHSQIINKCLLILFVDGCARRVENRAAPGAHTCTHTVALAWGCLP